ncbi:unnamed protein product, partial [Iphiclides podalirius]
MSGARAHDPREPARAPSRAHPHAQQSKVKAVRRLRATRKRPPVPQFRSSSALVPIVTPCFLAMPPPPLPSPPRAVALWACPSAQAQRSVEPGKHLKFGIKPSSLPALTRFEHEVNAEPLKHSSWFQLGPDRPRGWHAGGSATRAPLRFYHGYVRIANITVQRRAADCPTRFSERSADA